MFKHSYIIPRDGSRLLMDWEDFGPKNLPGYFNKGYKVFQKKLAEFKLLSRPLTKQEEQELSFMLESLIHAKNSTYEN